MDGSDAVLRPPGATRCTGFPLVNPLQGSFGGGAVDIFVSKFNAAVSTRPLFDLSRPATAMNFAEGWP
jgi:hypothetical protein